MDRRNFMKSAAILSGSAAIGTLGSAASAAQTANGTGNVVKDGI